MGVHLGVALLALACSDGKSGDSAATDDTAAESTDDTATDTTVTDAGGGDDTADTAGDDTGGDSGTTDPLADCVDHRPAYADCTGTWTWTYDGGPGPQGVDTFDADGDLVRIEIDNEGDGVVDTTIVQEHNDDGRVLVNQTYLGDAEPYTHVVYAWRDDGQLDSYRYLRNNGGDVDTLYQYSYDEDGRLDRFFVDARDDGEYERECAIDWESTEEGNAAVWRCFGEGGDSSQEQVYNADGLLAIIRQDDFNSDTWNREVFNAYADDCRLTEQATIQYQEQYTADVYERIERTLDYDGEGRWTGDTVLNIEQKSERPNTSAVWERDFVCP